MAAHATLSPSSSERWLVCPASVRLSAQVAGEDYGSSVYADEGTRAHALAELKASHEFGMISATDYSQRLLFWQRSVPDEDQRIEMERYVRLYVDYLKELKDDTPRSHIFLEKRVDTGVPSCWGTSDTIIVSPEVIHVVDLKYGKGIPVHAKENPQLMLYGVGALGEFGDVLGYTETVTVHIFQPRLGMKSSYSISAQDLRDWRDDYVAPLAKEALGPDARFNPTESACRWCPAAGECRARTEKILRDDFGNPDLLSPEEIGEVLHRVPEIKDWLKALEETALQKAYVNQVQIPGWKVVRSGGKRYVADPAVAIQTLIDHGYSAEDVAEFKVRTLGHLEKLVGKDELPEILGDLLVKSSGRESLVPEDDKRPAISLHGEAARDFGERG